MSAVGESTTTDALPEGWAIRPLGDLVSKLSDGSHNPPKKKETGRMMLSARNIENNKIVLDKYRFISVEDFEKEHKRTRVTPGDVLLTIVGTIGRAAVVPEGMDDFTFQRSVAVLTPSGLLPKYLMYQLQAPLTQRFFEENARGTAQKGVYLKTLATTPIRVAPMDQQERIVAEIEKQFSRLDEAIASIKRVKTNLKRYKAAVLKAAVEGKLTEEWRKQNPDVEPASKLLERILAERRVKWEEAELAKMKAKGKEPKNDKWKERYEAPELGGSVALSELPECWALARLDQIAEVKGGITKDSKRKATDFETLPYLRVANVQRGWIDIEKMKSIDVPVEKVDALLLEGGDILFNEGGDRDKLGRGWVWEGQIERCIYQNHVFRARLYVPQSIEPKFISWFGNGLGQAFFMSSGKQTTNLASINKTMLSSLPIPIPPAVEQVVIREQVDAEMARLDAVEESTEKCYLRAIRLRHSILGAAFSSRN